MEAKDKYYIINHRETKEIGELIERLLADPKNEHTVFSHYLRSVLYKDLAKRYPREFKKARKIRYKAGANTNNN